MGGFFSQLFAVIGALPDWFAILSINIFSAMGNLLKDMVSWVLESFLNIAVSAITSVDTSALSGVGAWGSAPADVMNILALLGVGQAVAIITAAITIRLLLQLIPFVRLGS